MKRAAFFLVAFLAGCSPQVRLADCGLPLEVPVAITESIYDQGEMTFSKDGQDLAATGTLDDRAFYAWGPDVYPTGHMFVVFTGQDEWSGLHVMEGLEFDLDPVPFVFYELAYPDFRRYMELVP